MVVMQAQEDIHNIIITSTQPIQNVFSVVINTEREIKTWYIDRKGYVILNYLILLIQFIGNIELTRLSTLPNMKIKSTSILCQG